MVAELAAGLKKYARKAFSGVKYFTSFIFQRKTIVLLCTKVKIAHTKGGFRVQEYTTNVGEITGVYKSVARYNNYPGTDDDARTASRLRHGMKYYAAYEGDKVIAYLWLHSVSPRFFDEVGIYLRHGPNDLWLRDVYVVPDKRGQGVFGSVINAVIREYYPAARHLYSDVMADNGPSLKAHRNLGMAVMGRVRFTRILRRILFREVHAEGLEAYGYKSPQRILFMDDNYFAFVNSNRC